MSYYPAHFNPPVRSYKPGSIRPASIFLLITKNQFLTFRFKAKSHLSTHQSLPQDLYSTSSGRHRDSVNGANYPRKVYCELERSLISLLVIFFLSALFYCQLSILFSPSSRTSIDRYKMLALWGGFPVSLVPSPYCPGEGLKSLCSWLPLLHQL